MIELGPKPTVARTLAHLLATENSLADQPVDCIVAELEALLGHRVNRRTVQNYLSALRSN